ncbi:hypothetical protein L208DRAFT_1413759 [Tricholoma matsutake]|nr:hypothetical protein L208DRAFT_1413759 [Tricholoma matsutake 945]
MTRFGDFKPLCTNVPSYPWCNLFYRQLLRTSNTSFLHGVSSSPSTAPVGINPTCAIPPTFAHSPPAPSPVLGNLANILACALSFLCVIALIYLTHRRKAAVGRVELRSFLAVYALSLPLQLLTTGGFLKQGGTALVVITAVHAGVVAALFWGLLANAVVATQVVEDGTLSSLVPYYVLSLLIFGLTTYISLDVALGVTQTIGAPSNPPDSLHSISLFVLLNMWPPLTAIIYFALMSYIVTRVLYETRPMYWYTLAAVLFILSQLAWFLLGKVICQHSNSRVDGSFVATILETATVAILYMAWRSITEESWDDDAYYPS